MKCSFGNLVQHAIRRHLGMQESCIEPSHRLREDLGLYPRRKRVFWEQR